MPVLRHKKSLADQEQNYKFLQHSARGILSSLQAQTLAEIAIDAREKAEKARQRVSEAESEVQAATVVKQKLEEDIERLRKLATTLPPDANQQEAMQDGKTLDLAASETGDASSPDIDAELKHKLQQLTDVTKTLDEYESRVCDYSCVSVLLLTCRYAQGGCHQSMMQQLAGGIHA